MATIIRTIANTKTMISGKPVIKPPVSDAFLSSKSGGLFIMIRAVRKLSFPNRSIL